MALFRIACMEEYFSMALYNLSFSSVYKSFISMFFVFMPQKIIIFKVNMYTFWKIININAKN